VTSIGPDHVAERGAVVAAAAGDRDRDHHRVDGLPPPRQHPLQGTGDGSEQGVVAGGSEAVGGVPQRTTIDGHHPDRPSRPGRPEERARCRAGRDDSPGGGEGTAYLPEPPRQAARRPQAPAPGVAGEHADRRTLSRERLRGVGPSGIDEGREHRQAADAVGEDVVEHHHQARRTVRPTRDDGDRPQRRIHRQGLGDHGQDGVEEGLLVPRRLAHHVAHVSSYVEVRVVDPDRSAAAEGRGHEALPQPRDRRQPLTDQAGHRRDVGTVRARLEHQCHADLLGAAAALHGEEGTVGGAGTLDAVRVVARVRAGHVAPGARRTRAEARPGSPRHTDNATGSPADSTSTSRYASGRWTALRRSCSRVSIAPPRPPSAAPRDGDRREAMGQVTRHRAGATRA
jgi:hypothetical protein